MMWYYGSGWGGMLWMGVSMLFWTLLLGLVIWLLVRWITRQSTAGSSPFVGTPPNPPSALEILRQRYARGEIDEATYTKMRGFLEETRVQEDRLQQV
jgi:putative membrane protein